MPPRPTLAQLLAPFKAKQSQYAFAGSLIAERAEARKLLAAAALYPLPHWSCPPTKQPVDERILWLWIWSGYPGGPQTPAFLDGLAAAAGISADAAYRVWPSLMISRVLFPDGELSDAAKLLLAIPFKRGAGRPPSATTTAAPKTPTEPKKESVTDGKE